MYDKYFFIDIKNNWASLNTIYRNIIILLFISNYVKITIVDKTQNLRVMT